MFLSWWALPCKLCRCSIHKCAAFDCLEYMTMLGAAAVVGFLAATEAFDLPTNEKVALDSLLLRVLGV